MSERLGFRRFFLGVNTAPVLEKRRVGHAEVLVFSGQSRTALILPLAGNALPLYGASMRREPNESELEEIKATVRRGDRLGAISLFISATEAGLTEAQNFVRALTVKENGESTETTTTVD